MFHLNSIVSRATTVTFLVGHGDILIQFLVNGRVWAIFLKEKKLKYDGKVPLSNLDVQEKQT